MRVFSEKANEDQLKLLTEGAQRWNDWREENPSVRPILNGAQLEGLDLTNANLEGARLEQANFKLARLVSAKMKGADLTEADLTDANFSEADLAMAQIRWAELTNVTLHRARVRAANLEGTRLSGANLIGADLRLANLTEADLTRAQLAAADLTGANCTGAVLAEANLVRATLREAHFRMAILSGAHLARADLKGAAFIRADLAQAQLNWVDATGASFASANLIGTSLNEAKLVQADLTDACLADANLARADIERATLISTDLSRTDFSDCRVYGVSAWDLNLECSEQKNLIVTPRGQPDIAVDNLEVAQFIYLLLNNERIRHVIDTITSKVVLILGRFTEERKAVLDALREELRRRDYLPVLFDFTPSASRDITETISLLARMARFVIADITDAKSIPQELGVIVPDLPSVPVQPLLLEGAGEYGMFEHFKRYPWVLPLYMYETPYKLMAHLADSVIAPAEAKVIELRGHPRT